MGTVLTSNTSFFQNNEPQTDDTISFPQTTLTVSPPLTIEKNTNTHLTEHDQRGDLIEMLHPRGPIRRGVSVGIHGQIDGAGRIGHVVRERLVLLQSVVEQSVNLVHPRPHERSDAGRRDAAEALQRWRQPEEVVRG